MEDVCVSRGILLLFNEVFYLFLSVFVSAWGLPSVHE